MYELGVALILPGEMELFMCEFVYIRKGNGRLNTRATLHDPKHPNFIITNTGSFSETQDYVLI